MSEPSTLNPVSLSASGYEDGLGRRSLEIDRESGAMLERLHLRPELGAFEAFLRERVAFTTAFEEDGFARVKAIERNARGTLTIVSQFVSGNRLSDLLEAATALPAHEATCPSVDAALGFLLEILPSLGSLHENGGHAHGTLAPGRIVLTPTSQVVILDWLYGPTIQRLQFNRRRLWTEFGIAAASAAGPTRLDVPGDISQAALSAMMIVLGRPLRENEYPDAIVTLVAEVIEIAQIRGSSQFASGFEAFLQRTLPLPSRKPHASAAEAADEVRHIAREIGVSRCRTALTAFVDDMNRVLAEEREQAENAGLESDVTEIDELTARLIPDLSIDVSDLTLDEPLDAEPPADAGPGTSFDEFDASIGSDAFEDPPPASVEVQLTESTSVADAPEPFASLSEPEIEPPPSTEDAHPSERWAPKDLVVPSEPEPLPEAVIAAPPQPMIPPAPAPVQPVPPPPPEPAPEAMIPVAASPAAAPTKPSKRKRRGSKGQRDKLRSNAAPKPPAAPVVPPPQPVAIPMPKFNAPPEQSQPVAIPMPKFGTPPDQFRQDTPPPAPIALRQPAPPKPAAPLRLKTDAPPSFTAPPARAERREMFDAGSSPYINRDAPEESGGNFPWKLAAAAVVGIIVVIIVGRSYIPGHKEPTESVEPAPAPPPPVAEKEKVEAGKPGTVSVSTQPAGAHVLLDGKDVGNSPVTLQGVSAGKHTLTFVTSSGTVKKPIRVEPGKGLVLDIPIYSGWIAVFSPVTLDISENGKAIGNTEQGRLMLSPGTHQLTFSNREMGYKTTQAVDIVPGEERSVSLVPTGELSVNAVPWAEVWMNGAKVGDTPLGNLHVPLGTHEVVFKNPKFPDRQVTVTVTASTPAVAYVDFLK